MRIVLDLNSGVGGVDSIVYENVRKFIVKNKAGKILEEYAFFPDRENPITVKWDERWEHVTYLKGVLEIETNKERISRE